MGNKRKAKTCTCGGVFQGPIFVHTETCTRAPQGKHHCAVKGCRRTIKRAAVAQQWPNADAWAYVQHIALSGDGTLYLCPLHRLELVERGTLTSDASRSVT